MSLIQITLVLGSVILLALYSLFMRSTLRDRVIALLFFAAAVIAILFPSLTTVVANALGVGRGTDLLIYLLILGSAFAFTMQNARILRLEDHITELVRELALSQAVRAEEPGDRKEDPTGPDGEGSG